jgi:hypothetical protein
MIAATMGWAPIDHGAWGSVTLSQGIFVIMKRRDTRGISIGNYRDLGL